jgi:hypothetical protein
VCRLSPGIYVIDVGIRTLGSLLKWVRLGGPAVQLLTVWNAELDLQVFGLFGLILVQASKASLKGNQSTENVMEQVVGKREKKKRRVGKGEKKKVVKWGRGFKKGANWREFGVEFKKDK